MLSQPEGRCAQCGKGGQLRTVDIIGRDRHPITLKTIVITRPYQVCKEGPCGGYLQMAHEG